MAIACLTPAAAMQRVSAGALLIDVREPDEHLLGVPKGALAVPRAALESEPGRWIAQPEHEVVLICSGGRRSMLAAEALSARGYSRVASVDGGFQRWCGDGLGVDASPVDADFLDRYSRHLRLPQVGLRGQQALASATVALVGAGGLGSPCAYYLAAAGVGRLILIDDDRVDRSNLQRQILHTDAAIGELKVESASRTLRALNPRLHVDARAERLDAGSVESLLGTADVVIDGADNFSTRYLLSAACVRLGKPLVYGAVHRFEGQLSVFDAGRRRGVSPCYRCLFPEPPAAEDAPNCAEAGVLGVLPGVIGVLQATEALKLLLGIGDSLSGRLLHFDALGLRFRETRLSPDPDCPGCGRGAVPGDYRDLDAICASH